MGYKTPSNAIIYELLDNEIILANLDSGVYYSIRGIGIPIWQFLIGGCPLEAIQSQFSIKYPHIPFDSSIKFVNRLLEEELLVHLEDTDRKSSVDHLLWPAEFSEPTLEKYEEMKDLLMLDPIHEVDEQGWPSKSI